MSLLRLLALSTALVAIACLSAAPAQASHVQCGDVITQDATLDSDLLNCPGDGVVIGADNITLDLNGHLIDGTGFPTSGAGVDNNAGHDGVTVIDGSIQEFAAGVQLTNASDNVITRLTLTGSAIGVSIQGDSDRNVVSRNVSEGGIGLLGDTDANLIERNTITEAFGPAIQVLNAFPLTPPEENRIERNTVSGAGIGIDVSGAIDTTVERNEISGAQFGISVGGLRTRVIQNSVSNSGVGIALGQASETEVAKNDVSDSTGDGIFVPPTVARDTLLDRNTSNRNGDDGIDVESTSTTISQNTANDNVDLGIEAVPGVTDGGGNKASGNGNPLQCLNVTCK
jgi:parallel beta-helix repeat protein